MGNCDAENRVFPLTGLQIGDLQSYLSDLYLFLGLESNKFYILVDNRPWLRDLGPRSAHLWQLMVTKSRLSPFANTKAWRKKQERNSCKSSAIKLNKFHKWFSLIDAKTLYQKRIPVKKLQSSLILSNELHRTLYGFIVFEVAWTNVRGINYLNELQADTSLAIEAKYMQRWEFDCIDQAGNSISTWFSGTPSERSSLKGYLDSALGDIFYDAEEDFLVDPDDGDKSTSHENLFDENDSPLCFSSSFSVYPATTDKGTSVPHTPPLSGPYKRRRVTKSVSSGVEVDVYLEEAQAMVDNSSEKCTIAAMDHDVIPEPTQYKDVLILFRFDELHLPNKLGQAIMSDLRLLTLLEAGLPSWVLFLQSYPGFCHLYRPWMCPLARALYVLISVVTVMIGFYDLYKNVPVLKATASRFCGPLIDWIETWEMVSRIKYLGTMLFLHNFQKAFQWFMSLKRATGSFFSVLILPLVKPLMEFLGYLLPLWNLLAEGVESFLSVISIVFDSSSSLIGELVQVILLPIWFIMSLIWQFATSVLYPILWILWEILYAPASLIFSLANFFAVGCSSVFNVLGDAWKSVSGIFQLAAASEATVTTYEISMWRSLWNDLFSQVFRAVRTILNGFVAFFAACNRHRLSIYNYIQELILRLHRRTRRSQSSNSRHRRPIQEFQHLAIVKDPASHFGPTKTRKRASISRS